MSKKYNIEELRESSRLALQNRTNDFSKACQTAFDAIIKDADEKIHTAMDDGRFRAYLYIWHYVTDKNDRQFTFNNVRILDLINKSDLIDKLRAHFGSSDDDTDSLYVDWHKFKLPNDEGNNKYGIYVSWAEHKKPTTDDASDSIASTSTSTTSNTSVSASTTSTTVKKVKAAPKITKKSN